MVSSYEHHAILNAAASEASAGRNVTYAKPKMGGYLVKDKITVAWHEGIKLVSIMAANNEIGTRNILKDLADHVHGKGALFHTDAVQALGHVPINVRAGEIDFLSGSAHKFNGPRGVGFLYKRKGAELKSLHNGGQQEFGFRAGTENVAGKSLSGHETPVCSSYRMPPLQKQQFPSSQADATRLRQGDRENKHKQIRGADSRMTNRDTVHWGKTRRSLQLIDRANFPNALYAHPCCHSST